MSDAPPVSPAEALRQKFHVEAEAGGYHLNPDREMALMLCEGLLTNLGRYGYMGCPCRLLDGVKEKDLDLICPCDYRDPDLEEYGACFCALYVSQNVLKGLQKIASIPERRPDEADRAKPAQAAAGIQVWRCKVCGYLAAREHPPERCPVCRAERDRFEVFTTVAAPPVWRCKVCGYLASRDKPPERCPICKAEKDRFENFRL